MLFVYILFISEVSLSGLAANKKPTAKGNIGLHMKSLLENNYLLNSKYK